MVKSAKGKKKVTCLKRKISNVKKNNSILLKFFDGVKKSCITATGEVGQALHQENINVRLTQVETDDKNIQHQYFHDTSNRIALKQQSPRVWWKEQKQWIWNNFSRSIRLCCLLPQYIETIFYHCLNQKETFFALDFRILNKLNDILSS